MAIITLQTIPAALLKLYEATLGKAREWKQTYNVRHRYPWRLPHMQGDGRIHKDPDLGADVSNAQFEHRKIFRRSCDCYNLQLKTHVIIDPAFGPKSRGYWFDKALGSGLWYYDYFMQQTVNTFIATGTPDYCKKLILADSSVWYQFPNTNYGDVDTLNINNSTTQLSHAYVTKNNPNLNLYTFFVYSISFHEFQTPQSPTIDVYEVDELIDEMGITWNNKPSFNRLIATFPLHIDMEGTFQTIQIPNVKSFVLIIRPPIVPEILS